ncbi:MAG: peptidylprolyl isomerase [Solirubrobacteraceae bacterium]
MAVVVAIAACGGGQSRVVARVGDTAITEATLDQWVVALAPGHVAPDPPDYAACVEYKRSLSPLPAEAGLEAGLKAECRQEYQALRTRALDFLITSEWELHEAAAQGLSVSRREVERRLQQREYGPFQAGTAIAELRFAVEAELASTALSQLAIGIAHAPTTAQVAAYYRAHRRSFLIPERRYIEIDNLLSEAAAVRAKREVESGRSFARMVLHEVIERPGPIESETEDEAARKAIFAAKPNVLTGPVPVRGEHSLFEVKRVVPARYRPLARVKGSIATQLTRERRQRALARFIVAWRSRWLARTACSPGYVVQKCRQYHGARAPEDPLTFD